MVQHMALASSVVLDGSITSISIDSSGGVCGSSNSTLMYVGTASGNIYQAIVDVRDGSITQQLVQSAHCAAASAIAFPELYGEVLFPHACVWMHPAFHTNHAWCFDCDKLM